MKINHLFVALNKKRMFKTSIQVDKYGYLLLLSIRSELAFLMSMIIDSFKKDCFLEKWSVSMC
jgi:hypothetical protein